MLEVLQLAQIPHERKGMDRMDWLEVNNARIPTKTEPWVKDEGDFDRDSYTTPAKLESQNLRLEHGSPDDSRNWADGNAADRHLYDSFTNSYRNNSHGSA